MTRPIKALILDADGVTQTPKLSSITGWLALGGPGLFPALSRAEKPTLTGGVEFEPLIAEVLAERGLDVTVDQVVAHWCRVEVSKPMLTLVDRVRAAGAVTAMGTNQNPVRGRYMLDNLPYGEHFDALFHSWQIGLAKPDPAFFRHIVEALGVEPGEAVFVDDLAANVRGAREAGLQAVHFPWLHLHGHLRHRLRALGVPGV